MAGHAVFFVSVVSGRRSQRPILPQFAWSYVSRKLSASSNRFAIQSLLLYCSRSCNVQICNCKLRCVVCILYLICNSNNSKKNKTSIPTHAVLHWSRYFGSWLFRRGCIYGLSIHPSTIIRHWPVRSFLGTHNPSRVSHQYLTNEELYYCIENEEKKRWLKKNSGATHSVFFIYDVFQFKNELLGVKHLETEVVRSYLYLYSLNRQVQTNLNSPHKPYHALMLLLKPTFQIISFIYSLF